MNYFIQGSKEKAAQIKAAFEKLGYEKVNVIHIGDYANERLFFFTENGKVRSTLKDCGIVNIIKTHPDYKELELPIQPKFKVGDWIVYKDGSTFSCSSKKVQVQSIENNRYSFIPTSNGSCNFIDRRYRLWTIEDAEDGDVLVTTKVRSCPFIYRKTSCDSRLAHFYAGIDGDGNFSEGCLKGTSFHFGPASDVVPATKEQRDLLFAKMKDAGYEWNAEKKELHKIQHYDISTFKPKQWVLVRDDDEWEWVLTRFSHLSNGSASLFVCINGASFQQCIPFDGNEKLLGTTDMPSEEYINW